MFSLCLHACLCEDRDLCSFSRPSGKRFRLKDQIALIAFLPRGIGARFNHHSMLLLLYSVPSTSSLMVINPFDDIVEE